MKRPVSPDQRSLFELLAEVEGPREFINVIANRLAIGRW